MSDFILEYDSLESIARNSRSLGKRAEEYSQSLESKVIYDIGNVTGSFSGYLSGASDSVRDKVNLLRQKSETFYHFAEQVTNLLEVAERIDREVADAIAAQRDYFLDHHESLRLSDWKAKFLNLLVDLKNSIPLLSTIADLLNGLDTLFESLNDSIRHWYECEGGKYILEAIGSIALAVVAIATFVIAFPVSGFFAICGAIGAGIAVVNSVTNVATSFEAAGAAVHDNPAWAMIYGKQDKLSDVLRQTNFGNGIANNVSNLSAGGLDTVETFCGIVGIVGMGADALKFFKGDAFKLLRNKDSLDFSDLKNLEKDGNVSLKNNIKQEYENLTDDIKELNKAGDISKDLGNGIKGGISAKGYSNFADGMSSEDAMRYMTNNEVKFFEEFSERASTAGLNDTQITEAFDAMKTGDYTKMSTYFDTSSPNNGAVFWSGNKDGAAAYANKIGGTIMEQTPGGQVFDNWRGLQGMYPEWENGVTPQKPIWTALSSQYAQGVSGDVMYAVKEGYNNPNSVWKTVELPILQDLQDEGIVTNIITEVIRSE